MIYLEINGREVRCELQEETVLYSKHTGKQLKHIEVKIIVENEYSHEKLLEIIKKGEGINSTDGKGNVMAGWTGIEPATSGLTGQRSNQAELPPHERQ